MQILINCNCKSEPLLPAICPKKKWKTWTSPTWVDSKLFGIQIYGVVISDFKVLPKRYLQNSVFVELYVVIQFSLG